jgi:hypothetical protein
MTLLASASTPSSRFSLRLLAAAAAVLAACSVLAGCTIFRSTGGSEAASGAGPAPSLRLTTIASPTVLHPTIGKKGKVAVVLENVGAANAEGEIDLKADLPAGLTVTGIVSLPSGTCEQTGGEALCHITESVVPSGFFAISVFFEVTGNVGAGPLVSHVSTTGGGAPPAASEASIRVGNEHETGPPGIAHFGFEATGPAGEPVTQAGAHPNFLTTSLVFNTINAEALNEPYKPVQPPKDIVFYLPLGMLGNPTVASQCPSSLVEVEPSRTGCPPSSRVGTILPMIFSNVIADAPEPTHEYGVYNVAPEKGYAAEFAFASLGYTFEIYASVVRRNGTYMLRISTPGVPAIAQLTGLVATFYGDIKEQYTSVFEEIVLDRGSFLTVPSDCGEDQEDRQATVASDTWVEPNPSLPIAASALTFPALEGCEHLKLSADLNVVPESTQADEPSSYRVDLEVPQAPSAASALGTPPVKNVEVKLPQGTTISPGSANGLVGCEELGPAGIDIEGPESETTGPDGLPRPVAGHCPAASQIGTVTARTPLLTEQLTGHMFLATPHCGGAGQSACTPTDAADGELFGLYLELEAPERGVIIKLKGDAQVDPTTGRITAVFREAPQFPFSKLSVTLKPGPRAPLANSQICGPARTEGAIAPWSEPATPPATSTSAFDVDWNGTGGGCPPVAPFAPAFTAGTTSATAGAFSSFALTLKREDREQDVASLSTTLPPGLLANVSKIARCPEPQASTASLSACPAGSEIGTVSAGVGSGAEPYFVTGKVYFTGPYGGAPFGLSVVVPAVAGPFNLGDVLVRVALFVDPHTAQVTAVSGPIPQILDGVPLRLRMLGVSLTAHEFVLNPTGCGPKSVSGTVYSTLGGSASVSSPFAASGCRNLAFKPALSGSTEAVSTKLNGTGVKVKIAYPPSGPAESNVAKVVVGFPKQLPVRLGTLQQACRANVFEANPAACPKASMVGTAVAHTPILAAPLAGPAYLVSYGSAKFPDVVFVLQGEGVTLDVDGQSFVSHSGALTVTFASVPDAPFSTFETVLPAGKYSQFTSARSTGRRSASQCGEKLKVPVTMVSQSGAEIKQTVKLKITGCRKKQKRAGAKKGHVKGGRSNKGRRRAG